MIKAMSNVQKLIKTLGRFETAKRFAAHDSLKSVSSYAGRESAKEIKKSKYSTAPIRYLRNRIDWRKQGGRDSSLSAQASTTKIRGGDIPVMYMRAKNIRVKTRLGMRWGVSVPVAGKIKERENLKGVFHLKSTGQRKLKGAGGQPFTKESVLFTSSRDGSIKKHRFLNMSEIMETGGYTKTVIDRASTRIAKLMERNIARHMRQINLSIG